MAADPIIARALGREYEEEPEWECTGLSLHPARKMVGCEDLDWRTSGFGAYRVYEYTCACTVLTYELVGAGGVYQIRRINQAANHINGKDKWHYAGMWRSAEAHTMWQRLLMGSIR